MKRKNKIGALFSVLLCVIMLFSMTLFTSCGETQSASSSDSAPISTAPEESSEPELIEHRTQSESLQTVTAAVQEQDVAALTLTGKAEEKTAGITYSLQGAFNLSDQNGDFSLVQKMGALGGTASEYSYAFLRDGSVFTLLEQAEQPAAWDNSVTFSYLGADGALESITGMEGIDSSTLQIVEAYAPLVISSAFSYSNAAILSLANFTNAANEEDNKITVDLNQAAYVLAADLTALLNRIEDDTTVESFLKDVVVADYMNYVTADLSTETIAALKASLLVLIQTGALGSYIGNDNFELDEATNALLLKFLSVSADRNSTAYEYLVKLLCSNELSALLTHIAQQQNEDAEEIKIGNILVKDILTALGTTKADLIAALDNVEEEQISTTITIQDTDYTLDFSDMQLVFTLNDDNTVSSLDITTTIKFLGAPVNISATIVYSDEELTLSDISACNVSVPHAIYNDGTRTETLNLTLGDDSDSDSAVAVKVNPVFADNALSAFVVTIDGNTIESTYDPDTATLTFTYNETEYVYTVVQQTFSQSIFDSEENGEILLIAVYPQGETADSGNVVRIQADQMETLTYTVEEFLAA